VLCRNMVVDWVFCMSSSGTRQWQVGNLNNPNYCICISFVHCLSVSLYLFLIILSNSYCRWVGVGSVVTVRLILYGFGCNLFY